MAVLFHCPWANAEAWIEALRAALPEGELRVWPGVGDPAEIDFAMVWQLPHGVLAGLPNLKGVSSLGAGVDGVLDDPSLPPGLPVARLVDPIMADRMAEYVAGHVLRHHLRLDDYRAQAAERRWQRHPARDARDVTVGLLGLGALGRRCAERLAGLGFRVAGWTRTAREVAGIAVFSGADGLAAMLPDCQQLVCLLPLTAKTRRILDARLFAQLPAGAALINCARGQHLDEAALLAALDDRRLAAATLDVFETEPLPLEHPFWRHPRITVTPHVSSLSEPASGARILAEQAARIRRGEPLRDLADRAAGY